MIQCKDTTASTGQRFTCNALPVATLDAGERTGHDNALKSLSIGDAARDVLVPIPASFEKRLLYMRTGDEALSMQLVSHENIIPQSVIPMETEIC